MRLLWGSRSLATPCIGVILLAAALSLQGCTSVGSITGAVAGAASGGASANPAVGIAVGIGVRAVVDESINAMMRRWSDEEQTRIATQVGALAVGQRQPWEVRHALPYDDKQRQVQVVRVITTPLAQCKEALFSVDEGSAGKPGPSRWFSTTACLGPQGWKWALAEPAVSRWGALQ